MRRWRVGDEEDAANGLWTVIHAATAQEAVDEWYRLYDLGKDDPDIKLVVSEWREPANQ
jgi:hypothetical protein